MNKALLQLQDDGYPSGFFHWLRKNRHIYREFEVMALEVARSGRTRYSARTIIEVIRWNTDLSDTDGLFKCNGNFVPGMARLWLEIYGEQYPKFFRCRDSMGMDLCVALRI